MKKCKVGIVGAAGYTGSELLRILANHGEAEVSYLASDSYSGKSIGEMHPHLEKVIDVEVKSYDCEKIAESCDIVFLAKPHPSSFKFAKELLDKEVKLIDLSAVFRLKDTKVFEDWYGFRHEFPELLSESVYGVSELYCEEIGKARLIANPGCYPIGVILGLAPLLKKGLVDTNGIIVDAVSGFSGAGKGKPNENNLAANVVDNIKPYKITNHPHTPEMEQELGRVSGGKVRVTFVPHVGGFERGIISTIFLKLYGDVSWDTLKNELYLYYKEFYKDKPFVRICGGDSNPEIKNVVYTNFCDIGIEVNCRTKVVIVTTAIDNLLKGASGQAVQNMNIMEDYEETEGLL